MSRSRALADKARQQADAAYHEFWATVVESSEILKEIAPTHRKMWLADVIKELYDEQNGSCPLCGNPLTFGHHHVDHKIPFRYGGGNERGNIQLVHPECNIRKGDQVDPHDLLRYLEDRGMNLPRSQ